MGTTRTELAIDEIDLLGEEGDHSCDDIRLAWLADAVRSGGSESHDFDALWTDR